MTRSCFLSGIGGSGMSALAHILLAQGWKVSGSDRSHDRGETPEKFSQLKNSGIALSPQDGSGLRADMDCLIVSSAVEEGTPDVKAARALNLPVRKRAEMLAELFNAAPVSIGVAGTSGKSTTTAMIGWILHATGRAPTIVNGAPMRNFTLSPAGRGRGPHIVREGEGGDETRDSAHLFIPLTQPSPPRGEGLSNAVLGAGENFVAEVDESDGSIVLFHPSIAVISNITVDHKPLEILRDLFLSFVKNTHGVCVLNLDDAETKAVIARSVSDLPSPKRSRFGFAQAGEAIQSRTRRSGLLRSARNDGIINFSLVDDRADFYAAEILPAESGVSFSLHVAGEIMQVCLKVPGRHNVANALAAMAAAQAAGVAPVEAAAALAEFSGISRRFEEIGIARGVTVIDDFAHNPEKIAATLQTLKERMRHEKMGRVWAIFQPHGFGPTKLMRAELVEMFTRELRGDDVLIMPEIYYAGGTATKDILAADIIQDVNARGKNARFMPERVEIAKFLATNAAPGDRIVLMGARDDTLPEFAREILRELNF